MLIDRGPHVVTVQPMRQADDRYGPGAWEADGDPVQVRGALQPAAETETAAPGVQTDTQFTFITRRWPYGPHTRVVYDGREYEQLGEARRYRMSPRTSHDDVRLRVVGADG